MSFPNIFHTAKLDNDLQKNICKITLENIIWKNFRKIKLDNILQNNFRIVKLDKILRYSFQRIGLDNILQNSFRKIKFDNILQTKIEDIYKTTLVNEMPKNNSTTFVKSNKIVRNNQRRMKETDQELSGEHHPPASLHT